MDQALKAEVEAWILDDPDPATAVLLQSLLEKSDGKLLRSTSTAFSNLEQQVFVAQ